MNGAGHYLESEQWIKRAGGTPQYEARMEMLAAAQVHAILALAAAQALPVVAQMLGDDAQITEWGRAIEWGARWRQPAPRPAPRTGSFADPAAAPGLADGDD